MANWQTLSSTLFALQDRLGILIATETAVENAIRSQAVPVRAWVGRAFARIEQKISDKSTVSILSSYIRLKPYGDYVDVTGRHQNEYNNVEVDVLKLERWLRENALPAELDAETDDPSQPPTAKAEKEFERWLKRQPESPLQIKDHVWASIEAGTHEIGKIGWSLSKRGFSRAWATAAHASWRKGGRRPARSED